MRAMKAAMVVGAAALLALPAAASGKEKVLGATLVKKIKPSSGFVDDPMTFDDAGGRLLYVNASVGGRAELRVLDMAKGGARLAAVDISSFTTAPKRVHFVLDGAHYFVVAENADKKRIGALVSAKKIEKTFGPARDLRVRQHKGSWQVVTYDQEWKAGRKGPPEVHHKVSIYDLKTARRIGAEQTLVADETGKVAKLDFTISYFTDDYTRIVGIKGGKWDRKEDQRTPDREAWYAVSTATFTKSFPIKDVVEHRKLQKILEARPNEPRFVEVARDLSGVLLYQDGNPTPIGLTEVFSHYDPKSLEAQAPTADGTIFFTLTIDPVHPDAAARRRAVPKYFDLYELPAGAKKAKRRARILLRDKRDRNWAATSDHWVVVPGHIGFDRGGKRLEIYKLK